MKKPYDEFVVRRIFILFLFAIIAYLEGFKIAFYSLLGGIITGLFVLVIILISHKIKDAFF